MSQGKLGDRDIADSLPPVLRETVLDQQTNRRRQVARERRPVRFAAQHRRDHIADVLAVEGAPAREHLVEHAAERPDVGALVRRSPFACSGLMYAAVPRIIPTPVIIAGEVIVGEFAELTRCAELGFIAFANPKSSTLTLPSA